MDESSAQPERWWQYLTDQAIAVSRCAGAGPDCQVACTFHRAGWAVISHIAVEPHICRTCLPRATPQHLVSAETLIHTERRPLVQSIARWLDHLHESPPSELLEAAA